jgi:hypothetical protein
VSGLGKRAKRALEAQRSEAFGATEKNAKMPFKMLLGIRKAEAKREHKVNAELLESGVVAATEKRDAILGGAKKRKKRNAPNDMPLDDVRDGVFKIKKDMQQERR